MTRRLAILLPTFLLMLSFTTAVSAGPFTDDLSRCLVKKTSEDDRALLIRWIYAAMSLHPRVSELSNVDQEIAESINKETAELFMTLVTDRCKSEAVDAIRYDGQVAFETSFSILGQVAMQGIMADPAVGNYMGGLEKHFDEERLKEAFEQ